MKESSTTYQVPAVSTERSWVGEISELFKLKLSLTVVFSSMMAYFITAASVLWMEVVILFVGGLLITGAANAFNQVLERDYDALMKRTMNRPVASGRMTVSSAVLIAGLSSLIGTLMLTYIHPMAGFFGMLSLVLYSFVYTPMKRVGPVAVFVGAIPGALPVLIGAVIGAEGLTAAGVLLFGIQFFWQMPHFWAIAWMGHEDYKAAGFRLLPTKDHDKHAAIGLSATWQALFIIPVLAFGYGFGVLGLGALIVVGLLTLGYAGLSYKWYLAGEDVQARAVMLASFAYLPLTLITLWIGTMI